MAVGRIKCKGQNNYVDAKRVNHYAGSNYEFSTFTKVKRTRAVRYPDND